MNANSKLGFSVAESVVNHELSDRASSRILRDAVRVISQDL
jgi:hypothetical protein